MNLVPFSCARIHELNSDDYSSEEEAQTPDCSITDFRKSQTLSYLVKELEVRMDLKAKMPDDHARKVRLTEAGVYCRPFWVTSQAPKVEQKLKAVTEL